MNGPRFLQQGVISLTGVAVMLASTVLMVMNSGAAWKNHQLRTQIATEINQAKPAMELVKRNSILGRPLDTGWQLPENSWTGVRVLIARETGIITISFSKKIEGKQVDLKLLPAVDRKIAILTNGLVIEKSDWNKIYWACITRDTRYSIGYSFSIPSGGSGSLPSRFAPAHCR
jgi:hypothetical protein